MNKLHALENGRRLIARTTAHPEGWTPWELSKAIRGALVELLAHDPPNYVFIRFSCKDDGPSRSSNRLKLSVVWERVEEREQAQED